MSNGIHTVGMGDYLPGGGGSQMLDGAEAQALIELNKGLTAGSLRGGETGTGAGTAGPLKIESLEEVLKVITFKETELAIWRLLHTMGGCVSPATNTVEEYNRLEDYGTDGRGVILNEGELPAEDQSMYSRQASRVKYYGKTGSVTHPAQLVHTTVGDLLTKEVTHLTTALLRETNRDLYFGNEDHIPQQIQGFFASQSKSSELFSDLITDETVVDLRGGNLTDTILERGCETILLRNGNADTLIAPPGVLTGFVSAFHESKRYNFAPGGTDAAAANGMIAGTRIRGFESQYGTINFHYDKFMNRSVPLLASAEATSPNAPGSPTAVSAAVISSDTSSSFNADTAGSYRYGVVARNRSGRSQLVTAGTVSAVANGAVDLTFSDASTTGDKKTTAFDIYCTRKGSTAVTAQYFYLFSITPAQRTAGYDGGGAGIVRDRNRIIPGRHDALLLQFDNQVLSWRQLGPLSKINLALIAPATRFMVLLYGTLQVYAPLKAIRFINVGDTQA